MLHAVAPILVYAAFLFFARFVLPAEKMFSYVVLSLLGVFWALSEISEKYLRERPGPSGLAVAFGVLFSVGLSLLFLKLAM